MKNQIILNLLKSKVKNITIFAISDSFFIENITNSKKKTSKIDDFEIILIGDLNQSLCLVFGTKLISYEKDLKSNFL